MFELSNSGQNVKNENVFSQNAIWSAIDNFPYAPEVEITFASYCKRYEDLDNTDCANFKKVRLQLRKLDTVDHTKFFNYILTKKSSDLTFTKAVQLLTELFSPKSLPTIKDGNAGISQGKTTKITQPSPA